MTWDSALCRQQVPVSGGQRYTERESSILCLIAAGHTNQETAHKLLISHHTVAQHIAEMLRAVGARSRAELVARAYSNGTLRTGVWPPELRAREPSLAEVTTG